MTGLELSHREEDGVMVIQVAGDLDACTAPQLRELTINLAPSCLVIDLSRTGLVDASGLGVLVGALKRVRAQDGGFAVACTDERVLKAFRICGLLPVLNVYDAPGEAVAAVRGDGESLAGAERR